MGPVRVVHLLNEASETSIPLEIAANLDGPNLAIDVCSFFEPAPDTFGIDVHWLEAESQFDPGAYLRFLRYVRRRDPDIVHIHPNGTGSIIRTLLAPTDIALVTTEHNDHRRFPTRKQALNGITNAFNDVLVANSRATRTNLAGWERGLARAMGTRIEVIHNGVDVDAVAADGGRRSSPELPEGPLVGTVGRLVEQKRQKALLRALPHVLDRHDDVSAIIAGAGPQRSDLEQVAAELGVADRVEFLGYLPRRRDVHAIMEALDVFAFPSAYEGFGVALAEAMAVGTAVVANDIPVVRELVGDAGVLVETDDEVAFGSALAELLSDANRRSRLEDRGRDRVRSTYPLSATVAAHRELYGELGRTGN